ncbi:MAG TPA: bifunctional glycosyltransferase family 2/GtrA family protein [Propionibacteriaceae bacterium]|nr:bifunctional glycosyltransferase family 2/GtrA family protein [Propionibacteriaceae bacterium]
MSTTTEPDRLTLTPATAVVRTRTVDLVIPVFNEQDDLERSVRRLDAFLQGEQFPWGYRITIADNASTDRTWQIAQRLSTELARVRAVHLDLKGRGRALKQVWLASDADVLAYMDVDLSTDLRALVPLVAPLISGHSDVAIGSRLARSARVARGPKREFISRSYNLILRTTLSATFSDAQCGFKALRRDVAHGLLPLVRDDNWFFDTELLVLAERAGLRIHEVPVDWTDDPGSTVNIRATATEDLRGVWRLSRSLARREIPLERLGVELVERDTPPVLPGVPRGLVGQLLRFGLVGLASTLAYFAIYLGLRQGLGAQASNLVALLVTAIANTAVNRAVTFHVRGHHRLIRDHLGGLAAFGVGLALTSGSLALLHLGGRPASRPVEVAVLIVANALATLFRFIALRQMMHRRGRH